MKRVLFFGSIVVIAVAVIYFVFFTTEPDTGPTPTPGLPIATSTELGGGFTLTPGEKSISVATRDGGSLVVRDFMNNGVTAADVQNPGTYYLAGSIGYCLEDGRCPSGAPAERFKLAYDAPEQFFTIALTDEPLGMARKEAEAFFVEALGVPKEQVCALKYYIGTTSYVNEFYAGKNLGLSFCPGAVKLPE